jgi:ATP-dependent Clp protease adapter protein ClpS
MAESNTEQKTDIEEDIDISDAFKAKLTLFNDSNLMEYVIIMLVNILNISSVEAYGLALRVHMSGKEVIKEGDDIHEMKRLYTLLKQAKLTVTLE